MYHFIKLILHFSPDLVIFVINVYADNVQRICSVAGRLLSSQCPRGRGTGDHRTPASCPGTAAASPCHQKCSAGTLTIKTSKLNNTWRLFYGERNSMYFVSMLLHLCTYIKAILKSKFTNQSVFMATQFQTSEWVQH